MATPDTRTKETTWTRPVRTGWQPLHSRISYAKHQIYLMNVLRERSAALPKGKSALGLHSGRSDSGSHIQANSLTTVQTKPNVSKTARIHSDTYFQDGPD